MAMQFSGKRVQIDRAKAIMVGSVGTAVFLVVFSIVGSKALLERRNFQSKVTKEQEKAVKQLRDNLRARDELVTAYKQFVEQPTNVIEGKTAGTGDRDGDNARIVLDALPSKYDFPALATSLEKILQENNFKVNGISGTDEELTQNSADIASAPTTPVEIPFTFTVSSTYPSIQGLIDVLHRSIRPIHIKTMSLSGKDNSMTLDITARTYYLPEKQLIFPTKEIKK